MLGSPPIAGGSMPAAAEQAAAANLCGAAIRMLVRLHQFSE